MGELIPRHIQSELEQEIDRKEKVILLFGPRQVGKTTLVRQIIQDYSGRYLLLNADETRVQDLFGRQDLLALQELAAGIDLLIIDEAQRIEHIGITLKLLRDNIPGLAILVTGSSTLELVNKTQEPLTGRTWTFHLFPVSVKELSGSYTAFDMQPMLPQWMVYGMYPEIFSQEGYTRKEKYLRELTSSYLYKDVLELASIRHPLKLKNLLRLLAFQIGQEVSYHELSNQLGMSGETVESYIDLLERSFVVFRLGGYSRNLRKEVTKMNKIYFYDLGVRNALIDNFSPLEARNDVGALWENFLVVERLKRNSYTNYFAGRYFWRTYTRVELDYVEESGGKLSGFEFKWNPKKNPRPPKTWTDTYPEASFQVIHPQNYLSFIL